MARLEGRPEKGLLVRAVYAASVACMARVPAVRRAAK